MINSKFTCKELAMIHVSTGIYDLIHFKLRPTFQQLSEVENVSGMYQTLYTGYP